MELNTETPTSPPRDAATVVMLRDSPLGMEVFLVKRHGLSDVLGGAYVFPGGKLDAADCAIDSALHLDQEPAQLHANLGEPDTDHRTAMGLYVAALREAFEESQVLFASGISTNQMAAPGQTHATFSNFLADASLKLKTSALLPWSRWITPLMPSLTAKRFDTRFFLACVPPGQHARHDDHETTESAWLRPRLALEAYWSGRMELAPPQIMSLAHLSRYANVHHALQEAGQRRPPKIFPHTFDNAGERTICYPGDSQHSNPVRAMPGLTRVVYRNRRFEPEGGFEAFFI